MIRLDNIHKAFGSKQVLTGFSLEVQEGDIAVILGYSGTGKSVAIKHIVGLLEPDQGTVWVDGREVPKLSRRELYELRGRIGYVFQFAALFDSLTVGENVAMGLRKHQLLSEAEIQGRVQEALALVDLPDAAAIMPSDATAPAAVRRPPPRTITPTSSMAAISTDATRPSASVHAATRANSPCAP